MAVPPVKTPDHTPTAQRVGDIARALFKSFASTARLMVGVPDYDAYVAHRKAMHPDEPGMT
ncbi:MAG: YbdD/YjiX family protein, partial [Hyphomicrobium sp.]